MASPARALEDPYLLQTVLKRDEAGLRVALARRAPPLAFSSVTALHAASLADWPDAVPLLLGAGKKVCRSCLGIMLRQCAFHCACCKQTASCRRRFSTCLLLPRMLSPACHRRRSGSNSQHSNRRLRPQRSSCCAGAAGAE